MKIVESPLLCVLIRICFKERTFFMSGNTRSVCGQDGPPSGFLCAPRYISIFICIPFLFCAPFFLLKHVLLYNNDLIDKNKRLWSAHYNMKGQLYSLSIFVFWKAIKFVRVSNSTDFLSGKLHTRSRKRLPFLSTCLL